MKHVSLSCGRLNPDSSVAISTANAREWWAAERAWAEINRAAGERYNEAPKATYDAAVHELRTHGLPQLSKPNCQRRLADLSIRQLKNLMASLQQRRGQYPNVPDELLTALAAIYDSKVSNEP